jgi:hypothetical protein
MGVDLAGEGHTGSPGSGGASPYPAPGLPSPVDQEEWIGKNTLYKYNPVGAVPHPTRASPETQRGFFPKSPDAGRTVVAGVFVEAAGFCEATGVAELDGRLEFSLVITESLKS